MLVLDFDGVIADALEECAAVTWFGGAAPDDSPTPALAQAVATLPEGFLALFRTVRAYSRTLDDFMVANRLFPTTRRIDRTAFGQARQEVGAAELKRQAVRAEALRTDWRTHEFEAWIAQHRIFPQVAALIEGFEGRIVILSAKDAESIAAILAHHGLAERISQIIGSSHDKRAALATLGAGLTEGEPLLFIDDSVANVIAASSLPLSAFWATWGYHGPEDRDLAQAHALRKIDLDDLGAVGQTTAPQTRRSWMENENV